MSCGRVRMDIRCISLYTCPGLILISILFRMFTWHRVPWFFMSFCTWLSHYQSFWWQSAVRVSDFSPSASVFVWKVTHLDFCPELWTHSNSESVGHVLLDCLLFALPFNIHKGVRILEIHLNIKQSSTTTPVTMTSNIIELTPLWSFQQKPWTL